MCPAVVTAVTHHVPLHLYGSSQLSGSALSWPRALTSLSPNLPASSTNRAETPDAEGSVMRASRQSAPEREVLPRHLRWDQGRAKRMLSHRKQETAAPRAGRRTGLGEGQEVVMAGMQQAVSLSPGLGGVNSKALTDGGTMAPHFPNSPRGIPLLVWNFTLKHTISFKGRRSQKCPRKIHPVKFGFLDQQPHL